MQELRPSTAICPQLSVWPLPDLDTWEYAPIGLGESGSGR